MSNAHVHSAFAAALAHVAPSAAPQCAAPEPTKVHSQTKDREPAEWADPIIDMWNDIERVSETLGRQKMALDVLQCWTHCRNASDALDEIIALCRREAQ